MPITTFDQFGVVAVPFPYVERAARKRRPALIISGPELVRHHGLLWVAMITSADNPSWHGDVHIDDLQAAGLPKPSVVRPAKLATVEAAAVDVIGRISGTVAAQVCTALDAYGASHPRSA